MTKGAPGVSQSATFQRPTAGGPASPRPNAFTLIELLVAIFIIAILISLVVAVAGYVYDEAARKQTQSIQNLTMRAVEAYYELIEEYPADPNDLTGTPDPNAVVMMLLNQLQARILTTDSTQLENLKKRIKKATGPLLLELPSDALDLNNDTIRDAFGNPMEYYRTGGLGGRPVLVSAGPDGLFLTDDDIRSGEH